MTRDEAIEAMAEAIWDRADDEVGWRATLSLASAGETFMQGQIEWARSDARAALDALTTAIPGLSDLLDGRAVIVPVERRVRHKKRQSTYAVLGLGEAQVSVPRGYTRNDLPAGLICDETRLVVYREEDGKFWLRFPDEFEDGRFETLSDSEWPEPRP